MASVGRGLQEEHLLRPGRGAGLHVDLVELRRRPHNLALQPAQCPHYPELLLLLRLPIFGASHGHALVHASLH